MALRSERGVTVTEMEDEAGAAGAYGAVVLVADRVYLHVAARTRAELFAALARWAAERAPMQLWPDDAERVARWLERGDREKAVMHYFATVGARWDRERLHLAVPRTPRRPEAARRTA